MEIQIPSKLQFFLKEKSRFKCVYGGRGSGKSESIARSLIVKSLLAEERILCAREFQISIADSVHKLLTDVIYAHGLDSMFEITKASIKSCKGSEFIFKGIRNNINEIKSLQGISICWCFIAGTLIDGKNIEEIREGDFVNSFNHQIGRIEKRKVLKTMKREAPEQLYKLLTSYGLQSTIGTSEHPIYVKNKGYISLSEIVKGDIVYAIKKESATRSSLFRWLRGINTNRYKRSSPKIRKEWGDKLLGLRKKSNIKADVRKKSDGQPRIKEEAREEIPHALNGGCWQWSWLSRATESLSKEVRAWLVDRIGNSNWLLLWRQRIANQLQDRCGEYLFWNSNRDRWSLTQGVEEQRRGRKEGYVLTEQRVESVEIQEFSSDERSGLSDGGDYVYNFEVEGNNNYFANGLLVHNCEEAQKVSENSWDVLIPTIRKKESEIWVSFNPDVKDDATYRRFVENKPEDCISVLCNYYDNPFFQNTELLREMEYDKQFRPEVYQNKWLGKNKQNSEALIFKNKYEVKDFETPDLKDVFENRFFYGVDWGFACLKGDTLIKTNEGEKQIQNIKVGDYVLTREGYKQVVHFINKGKKDVYELDFGFKNPIIATGDHLIYTLNGWKRVDELKAKETVCITELNLTAKFIKNILKVKCLITVVKLRATRIKRHLFCTGISGNRFMVKSRMEWLFITLMKIKRITTLPILLAYRLLSTQKYTFLKKSGLCQKRDYPKSVKNMATQSKTGKIDELNQCKLPKNALQTANSVIQKLFPLMFTKSFAMLNAEKKQTLWKMKKNIVARFVKVNLWLQRIAEEKPVLKSVQINLRKLKEKSEVFDITVENGEFFANGMLVHNCDPSALVRCFIQDECLFIDYEAGGIEIEMQEIKSRIFDKVPDSDKWNLYADCARPETIAYCRRLGYKIEPAPKWGGSVEDGIEYLKSFKKIIIHPRCKQIIEEMGFYSFKTDRITGEPLPIIIDKYNHYIDALRYSLSKYIKKNKQIISF